MQVLEDEDERLLVAELAEQVEHPVEELRPRASAGGFLARVGAEQVEDLLVGGRLGLGLGASFGAG